MANASGVKNVGTTPFVRIDPDLTQYDSPMTQGEIYMQLDAIHVGLPKCASNLLQRDILTNHNGLECITPKFNEALKPWVDKFLAFGADWEGERFAEKCCKQFSNSHSVKILSQEGFS